VRKNPKKAMRRERSRGGRKAGARNGAKTKTLRGVTPYEKKPVPWGTACGVGEAIHEGIPVAPNNT